ncbi:MAG TPA: hypothetical protein VG733_05970 [Chthoniobacteraceae bacterium]|nr:hypothetical protein [Chthoniobacteraceae bacterium]
MVAIFAGGGNEYIAMIIPPANRAKPTCLSCRGHGCVIAFGLLPVNEILSAYNFNNLAAKIREKRHMAGFVLALIFRVIYAAKAPHFHGLKEACFTCYKRRAEAPG